MTAKLSAFERLASRANTHTWDAPLGLHNECWSWCGSCDAKGYGFISVKGRTRRVHIVAWELATGRKLRKGYTLQHKCRNTSCWRPSHVEVMSRSRNTADGNRNNPRSTEKARAVKAERQRRPYTDEDARREALIIGPKFPVDYP